MSSEFDGGLDAERTIDAQDAFVVDVDVMAPIQLVPYPAVAHIRVGLMDFLHLLRDALVFLLTVALWMPEPSVICRPCEVQETAEFPYWQGAFLR